MGNKIIEIIKLHNPKIVFIEDVPIVTVSRNKKVSSALSWLCILQGYIISILDGLEIEYRLYLPNKWRTSLDIVTQPKIQAKKDTIRYVNDKFKLELKYHSVDEKSDDNTADAIGIACCGIQILDG
jgi:Holliday junction resolvasome RuvABC endonuclease subunit